MDVLYNDLYDNKVIKKEKPIEENPDHNTPTDIENFSTDSEEEK